MLGAIRPSCTGLAEPASGHGPCVNVRRMTAADRSAVLRMHARCSRETRNSRWMGPSTNFPLAYLRSLLAGGAEHIGVVSVADCELKCVIGLASAAMTSDGCWELGVLVEDRFQAQGIGRLMMDFVMELLDPHQPVCAYSLTENRWLLAKLARFGTVKIHHDFDVSSAWVDRAPAGCPMDGHPAGLPTPTPSVQLGVTRRTKGDLRGV